MRQVPFGVGLGGPSPAAALPPRHANGARRLPLAASPRAGPVPTSVGAAACRRRAGAGPYVIVMMWTLPLRAPYPPQVPVPFP